MTDKDDNVYQLFGKQDKQDASTVHKVSSGDVHISEQSLRAHFEFFLSTLDASLDSFHELSVMDKLSLYRTLVEFTHVSLESYLKLKGE